MSCHWINGRNVSDSEWFAELDAIARDDEITRTHLGESRVAKIISRDWATGSAEMGIDDQSASQSHTD